MTWYGFDQNETIDFNGRNPAGLIWANVMARIHTGLKTAKFEKPSMVLSATVCSETGKRATTGCPNTYTEYFLWFTTPDMCDKHKGEEVKDESNRNSTNNNITEIVQGITEEIDEKEPPRTTEPTDTRNTINKKNCKRQLYNLTILALLITQQQIVLIILTQIVIPQDHNQGQITILTITSKIIIIHHIIFKQIQISQVK